LKASDWLPEFLEAGLMRVVDDKLYYFGGWFDVKTVYEYDDDAGVKWSLSPLTIAGPTTVRDEAFVLRQRKAIIHILEGLA